MAEFTLPGRPEQLNKLIQANIQDFLEAFGLEDLRRGRKLVEALCWLPARRFANQMVDFDRKVGEQGLHLASSYTLNGFASRLEVVGGEHVPSSGPLLVLSNHPGMTDTLALFSSLKRLDLRIVASERPFLHALTNVSRQLIYVPEDTGKRMGVVRNVVNHLRRGGAALTFPAGEIEPDPACMPGAVDSLGSWSESIAVFARLVPETRIIVAIVSGVIWPATLTHPLTRLGKGQKAGERIAANLQILAHMVRPSLRPVAVRVAFSPPMPAGELAVGDPARLMEAVTGQARSLILAAQPGSTKRDMSHPDLNVRAVQYFLPIPTLSNRCKQRLDLRPPSHRFASGRGVKTQNWDLVGAKHPQDPKFARSPIGLPRKRGRGRRWGRIWHINRPKD